MGALGDIIVFGGDGYIGWPLSVELAATYPDRRVIIADNFLTRRNCARVGGRPLAPIRGIAERIAAYEEVFGTRNLVFRELDCADPDAVTALFAGLAADGSPPAAVFHLAHQRAAPYSMLGLKEAIETVTNNEVGFLNLIWSLKEYAPDCHLVKLGSFGAYAKPGLDIPEGDACMSIGGRTSEVPVPFPRMSDDFYHITKINDGKFAGLACRKWGLRITDVMQSTVFGAMTAKTLADPRLNTRFDYDEILGTVVNRFVTQALAGLPMTVYGSGTQTSGIMVLADCVRVLTRLAADPGDPGVHRIVNNSPRSYTINELAGTVQQQARALGLDAEICRDQYNPRFEDGIAYDYKVETRYLDATLTPTPLSEAVAESLRFLRQFAGTIDRSNIVPTHTWLSRGPGKNGHDLHATGLAIPEALRKPASIRIPRPAAEAEEDWPKFGAQQ
jgi:UDP-sulfoquinovose synthase